MSIKQIGLIGLGIMGIPMTINLIKAGYCLNLYARNNQSLKSFNEKDINIYETPAELARHCHVVITIVSDTPDVIEIITGNNGLMHGALPDSVIIDMSTISPEITRDISNKLSKRNIHMIDAPVSGGEIGAIDGTLSIMVGGKDKVFEKVLPILKCLGKNIVHVGDHGAGQVAKACNQLLVAQTMSAVAEAIQLAKSSGVDPSKMREALLGGFAYSKILEIHGKRILDENYEPGFKATLHNKDIKIALNSAKKNEIYLPGTELVSDYLDRITKCGLGEKDSAVIAKAIFKELD